MSHLIPVSSINKHEEIAEDFINTLGKTCTLIYPPLKIQCINCVGDGRTYGNGPVPFTNNSICPYCEGEGFTYSEESETVKMMVYFSPKDWLLYNGIDITIPDNMVQTRGLISLLPKIQRATSIIIHVGIEGQGQLIYKKEGEWIPFGARLTTEFLQMWKRNS